MAHSKPPQPRSMLSGWFWFFLFFFLFLGVAFGVLYAHLKELPDISNLNDYKPSQSTRIYDRQGKLISQLSLEKRTVVPLEKMPPHLLHAVIAIEDERFYDHWGVDLVGVLRAFLKNLRHQEVVEGASTITQQLARNLFLTREKTLARKIREALLAVQIERNFTKDQILELYLNQIYFGAGAYGVEAAARTYFGKHTEELTPAESALLAGLPKAPSRFNPYRNPLQALERRNLVIQAMEEKGYLTAAEAMELQNAPLELKRIEMQNAPYFVEYVRQILESRYGTQTVYRGGLSVYTTLDLDLQKAAEQALLKGIEQTEERARARRESSVPLDQPLQGALLALEPSTGAILAMVGGRDFQTSVFNRAVQAERQPGSAFKPFIYTTALEKGFTLADTLLDAPVVYQDETGKDWRPTNYSGKFHGRVTLHTALMYSMNVPTIRLLDQVGVGSVITVARRLGISSALQPNLSLGLGTSEVTLLEMVQAFNVFANQGVRVEPFAISSVKDSDGRVLEAAAPSAQAVLDPVLCSLMVHVLKDVVDRGTARIIRRMGFTRPAAGKTGTTNNNVDAWFIGFTPDLTCGVWVGYDERQSLGRRQTGGAVAAPIWADFMKKALEGLPPKDFPVPEEIVEKRVCQESGALAAGACPRVLSEWFRKDTVPLRACPLHGVPSGKTQDPWAGGQPPKDLLELEGPSVFLSTPTPAQPASAEETPNEDQEVSEATAEKTPESTWQAPAGDWDAEEGF